MASIRNNKNIQSAVASAVFVGLRAESCYASKLFNDEDEDIFEIIETLKQNVETLTQQNAALSEKLENLSFADLKGVDVSSASNGDALVYQNGTWQPAEQEPEA